MARFERAAIFARSSARWRRAGEPIVGGGAGTGLSAKCEEAGGIDLIVIYNSGRYRMAGRGSLAGLMPYGDANAIVVGDGARSAAGRQARRRCSPASTAPTRSAIMDVFLDRVEGARLCRRAELSDRRPDRRHLPRQISRRPACPTRWRSR